MLRKLSSTRNVFFRGKIKLFLQKKNPEWRWEHEKSQPGFFDWLSDLQSKRIKTSNNLASSETKNDRRQKSQEQSFNKAWPDDNGLRSSNEAST